MEPILALAGEGQLGNFRGALLTRREQLLIAAVLLAFLTGLAVKQWRSTGAIVTLPAVGTTSP